MRRNVRDVTSLHIIVMFIVADMARWAATQNGTSVIQSHHLQNGMLFAFAGYSNTTKNEFFYLCVL